MHTQVAIVGGGPVGLGLAIDLGQRGIDVAVFEATETIHNIPKGQNLSQRTGEHFLAWGIYEQMKKAVRIPASFGTSGVTTYNTLLGEYHYNWLDRKHVRQFYAADSIRLPQYDTERLLRKRASEFENVEVHYGHTVECLAMDDAGPVLEVDDGSGAKRLVRATFVVGCDGARSVVRECAGITRSFRSHFRRMVLALFRSEELNDLLERFPKKSYFNALAPEKEGYWQFFGRVEFGSWFFHTPVPVDSTLENFDLGIHLTRAVGKEINFETEYLGFWNLRTAIADSYRRGKVFIAGDAAHSHPPYGGYGLNNGLEDVRNLAWKLEASLRGWGSEALLDSYTDERHPVFDSTADDFIGRMISDDSEFVRKFDPGKDREAFEAEWSRRAESTKRDIGEYCPNYGGSPIVVGGSGRSSAVGRHEHKAVPGFLLTPQSNVMDKLGPGFSLVTVGSQPRLEREFAAEASVLGMPLEIVKLACNSETERWESRAILVRPDRFVAHVGGKADLNAAKILRTAIGQS